MLANAELERWVREANLWRSYSRYYALLKHVGVMVFLAALGGLGMKGRPEIYFVASERFREFSSHPVSKILDAKHNFILRDLKGQFTGALVTDGG